MPLAKANPERPVTLDDPASLPDIFANQLEALRGLFAQTTCFDDIYRDGRVKAIYDELEQHLRHLPIRAYHCTREPYTGYFATNGLRLTNLDQHQQEFIQRHGHQFSQCEIQHMRKRWYEYFRLENRPTCRDNNLWFCLTKVTCESDGVDPFFRFFGGEAIHKPLQNHSTITAKLQNIGQPVIVEIKLLAGSTASCYPLAKHVINAWHRKVRTDVEPTEGETFICCSIPPRDIFAVRPVTR